MHNKENSSVKKNLCWAMISLLIAILTIYTVIKETKVFSIRTMMELLSEGRPVYIFIAGICMMLYIYAEGAAIRHTLNKITKPVTRRQGFVYSAADVLFSAITPSASGGQPASMFFMAKDGVSLTVATLCLIFNLMMYNASIVVIAIACIVFRMDIFMAYNIPCKCLVLFGIVILSGLMIGFYMLLKKSELLLKIGYAFVDLAHKFHIIKRTEKWQKSLSDKVERYTAMSNLLFQDKTLTLQVFFINLLQRSIQICIAPLVYLGLGGSIRYIGDVWFTQAYSTIGSNCIPVPGAMGVVDYLLIHGFDRFMTDEMAVHTEMLTRGMSFYICIAISLVTVLIAYILRNRGKEL